MHDPWLPVALPENESACRCRSSAAKHDGHAGVTFAVFCPCCPTHHSTGPARKAAQAGEFRRYDDKGAIIPCTGTGQDGEFCTGLTWPAPRFCVEDETAVDRLTGLVWRRAASLAPEVGVTWHEALAAVVRLNSENGAGWRLPNINELESLVDCTASNPALLPLLPRYGMCIGHPPPAYTSQTGHGRFIWTRARWVWGRKARHAFIYGRFRDAIFMGNVCFKAI